jgi:hypothetical protein
LVESVIGAILSLTLLGYMLLGNYTRYVADDYGTAIAVTLRGYWAQQVAAYRLTDGHFVATALQTAVSLLNPTVVRVLPGILIVAWVAALVSALRHLVPNAGRVGRFLVAAGIVYTTLRVTPSPFLALYWMTASVAFVVPLIIAAVVVWLITSPTRRGRLGAARLILIGLLAFIASGEAEIYTVAAFVASTIAVVVAISPVFQVWRARLPQIAAAWIGAVAGLAAELASPGNVLRSAVISKIVAVPRPSFIELPFFTFVRMLHFVHALVLQHWRGMLALALLATLIAARSGAAPKLIARSGLIALVLATLGTAMVVWAAMAPAALEFGGLPPLYDQVILVYACVCAVVTLGWIAGRVLRNRVDAAWTHLRVRSEIRGLSARGATLVVAAIVVTGPIATLAMMYHDLPSFEAYAAGKDAQAVAAEAAHAAGRSTVIVRSLVNVENIGILDHTPLEELTTDPTYWINQDTAEYYGIQSMAVPR